MYYQDDFFGGRFKNSFRNSFLIVPSCLGYEDDEMHARYMCSQSFFCSMTGSVLYPAGTKYAHTVFDMAKHFANIAIGYCTGGAIRKEAVFAVAYELINEQKEFWEKSEKKCFLEDAYFSKLVEILRKPKINLDLVNEYDGVIFKDCYAYKRCTALTKEVEKNFTEVCELAYNIASCQKQELGSFQLFWAETPTNHFGNLDDVVDISDDSLFSTDFVYIANENQKKAEMITPSLEKASRNAKISTKEPPKNLPTKKRTTIRMADLARKCHVKWNTVLRWVNDGILPAPIKTNKGVFFDEETLLETFKKSAKKHNFLKKYLPFLKTKKAAASL